MVKIQPWFMLCICLNAAINKTRINEKVVPEMFHIRSNDGHLLWLVLVTFD